MSYAPPQPAQPKSNSGKKLLFGCLGFGCLSVLLVGAGIIIFAYMQIAAVSDLIEDTPRVKPYEPTQAQIEQMDHKVKEIERAKVKGKSIEIVLTPEDINTWLAEQEKEDKGELAAALNEVAAESSTDTPAVVEIVETDEETPRIRVDIEGNRLAGKISLPIRDEETGKLQYLNGEAVFTAAVVNGQLEVYLKEVKAKGKKLPAVLNVFVNAMKDENLAAEVNTNPEHQDLRDKLQHCERFEVKDGKIYIKINFPEPTNDDETADPGADGGTP